jgi:hypothetical protein
VLFTDDLAALAAERPSARHAPGIAADLPGATSPRCSPAAWLPPTATVTFLREDADVV